MNDIEEPSEYWGEWFLPGKDEEKYCGVLKLSKGDFPPTLELVNVPSDFRLPSRGLDNSPVIFGTTIDGNKISLHKCNFGGSKIYLMTKKQILKIVSPLIFVNNDQDNNPILSERFTRDRFDIEYNLLYSWLWRSLNYHSSSIKGGKQIIERNDIKIAGKEYTIKFVLNVSESASLKESSTKRNVCLTIKSKKGNINFEEVLQFNKYFQSFLSFATAEKVCIKKLTGNSSVNKNIPKDFRDKFRKNEVKIPSLVHCIVYQGDLGNLKDELLWDQMLFDHEDLIEQHLSFKESFEMWIKIYNELSFYQAMFDSLYGNQLDTLSRFILLVPRVEQYCINMGKKDDIGLILDQLVSENKEIVKKACVLEDEDFSKAIAYKNKGKKNNCENGYRKPTKFSRFAEDCKNIRNFYAHVNKCYEDKIPQDTFVQTLTAEKLKLLFDILILKELGFKDQDFIIDSIKQARRKTLLPQKE